MSMYVCMNVECMYTAPELTTACILTTSLQRRDNGRHSLGARWAYHAQKFGVVHPCPILHPQARYSVP